MNTLIKIDLTTTKTSIHQTSVMNMLNTVNRILITNGLNSLTGDELEAKALTFTNTYRDYTVLDLSRVPRETVFEDSESLLHVVKALVVSLKDFIPIAVAVHFLVKMNEVGPKTLCDLIQTFNGESYRGSAFLSIFNISYGKGTRSSTRTPLTYQSVSKCFAGYALYYRFKNSARAVGKNFKTMVQFQNKGYVCFKNAGYLSADSISNEDYEVWLDWYSMFDSVEVPGQIKRDTDTFIRQIQNYRDVIAIYPNEQEIEMFMEIRQRKQEEIRALMS